MAGRAQAFSDPTVIELASRYFVPVAENCSPLQRQQDAKGAFFRLVAEQGHYQGRVYPTNTRQGYYAFTSDGKVLGAMNARDPEHMTQLLRRALARWDVLGETGAREAAGAGTNGGAGHAPAQEVSLVERIKALVPDYVPAHPDRYPSDGLVLRLAARDLPRNGDTRPDDWRKTAWNLDYAWFTRDEARALVPQALEVGAQGKAPAAVIRRLALFHLRDFVRGEPPVWPEAALREGALTSEIVAVEGATVRLALHGRILLDGEHQWVRPDDGTAHRFSSGIDATLVGEARWDADQQRFVAFELVAVGPRWGAAQYNNRMDDLGPAPLGIALTLAGSEPRDHTPPHQIGHREYFGAPTQES